MLQTEQKTVYVNCNTNDTFITDTFNAFKIDPNSGQISTTVQINYEEATFYTLTVIATDSNYGLVALSSSALVIVMVSILPSKSHSY